MNKGIQRLALAIIAWAATGTMALAASPQELEKSCNQGNADDCRGLGLFYYTGYGVREDNSMAVKFYSKACAGGSANGCADLASMYHRGEGVRQDKAKAAQFSQKACEGGVAAECEHVKEIQKEFSTHRQSPQPAAIPSQAGGSSVLLPGNPPNRSVVLTPRTKDGIQVGSRVRCNWKAAGTFYPGTVTRLNGVAAHIKYDDGDEEDTHINYCKSESTSNSQRPFTRRK